MAGFGRNGRAALCLVGVATALSGCSGEPDIVGTWQGDDVTLVVGEDLRGDLVSGGCIGDLVPDGGIYEVTFDCGRSLFRAEIAVLDDERLSIVTATGVGMILDRVHVDDQPPGDAGVGESGNPSPSVAAATESSPMPPVVPMDEAPAEPPARFEITDTVSIDATGAPGPWGDRPVFLAGDALILLPGFLLFDVRTGEEVPVDEEVSDIPIRSLAQVGEGPDSTFVTTFLADQPGSGLAAGTVDLKLAHIGADGTLIDTIVIVSDFEPDRQRDRFFRDIRPWAADDGTIVVAAGGAGTYGVDLDSARVTWHAPDLSTHTVIGEVAIGELYRPELQRFSPVDRRNSLAIGVDTRSGDTRWELEESEPVLFSGGSLNVTPAGPDRALIHLDGSTTESLAPEVIVAGLLDTVTGDMVWLNENAGLFDEPSCRYDGIFTLVCDESGAVVGRDQRTGERLWRLVADEPSDSLSIDVSTLHQGLVYGSNANGDLVLDARTGEVVETDPGAAPFVVTNRFGIIERRGGVEILPALTS